MTDTAARPAQRRPADIRIGYARCSFLTQELQSQLNTLAAHGIARRKIFAEKIFARVRVRPQFEAALALARARSSARPALPGHPVTLLRDLSRQDRHACPAWRDGRRQHHTAGESRSASTPSRRNR
ncbi:recombinase family protein [Nonomuraea rosea]|uniref:recombinase family protein n=1 Tax=Nonomuraea rosea TaxID=638574 RepID=UPI0031E80B3F